ncbi:MAG: T9SS type A sorting domain-containing protein, partial [Bacteroidales bacterium]|nr:T9SS type A sorting domain-containing protein [Bacteroidales bacterium]
LMKKFTILILILSFFIGLTAQKRVEPPRHLRNIAIPYHLSYLENQPYEQPYNPYVNPPKSYFEEEQIGNTLYDNQSNASIPNRIYLYNDGTIAATWTRSMDDGMFNDRGTGYNYFDGESWDDWPDGRIEDIKVHRPSYAPWGENGEIAVTHTSGDGLYIANRPEKGTGDWQYSEFHGPDGFDYLLWNRVMTSGSDRSRIHLLAMTLPSSHGGTPYLGIDGAILYSLSTDGGNTWDIENEILDGMDAGDYVGFDADCYTFAEPKDDIVAFVVGGPWYDMFLMKSEDGGESFDQTVIWENPYPLWELGMQADTFYCVDGAMSAVIDNEGMVHVAFGITRVSADADFSYWYPVYDGIGYWNESMPEFSGNLNALNPYGHPDSELEEDVTLVGWSQDVNNNGQLDLMDDIGLYWLGLSSMPQLVMDANENMYLVYSSVTEGFDNGALNYRHIWTRHYDPNAGGWGEFTDLTADLLHVIDECVYPACAPKTNDYVHLIYQFDQSPGTATWGNQHPYEENLVSYIKIPAITTGIEEPEHIITISDVSQNFPNPFKDRTVVNINLKQIVNLNLEIRTVAGQKVYETPVRKSKKGINTIEINAKNLLLPGVYFYTVKAGESSVTRKMIVE